MATISFVDLDVLGVIRCVRSNHREVFAMSWKLYREAPSQRDDILSQN